MRKFRSPDTTSARTKDDDLPSLLIGLDVETSASRFGKSNDSVIYLDLYAYSNPEQRQCFAMTPSAAHQMAQKLDEAVKTFLNHQDDSEWGSVRQTE